MWPLRRRTVLGILTGALLEGWVTPGLASTPAPKLSKTARKAADDNQRLIYSAYAGRDLTTRLAELRSEAGQPRWRSRASDYDRWSRDIAMAVARFRNALWRHDLGGAQAALAGMFPFPGAIPPDAPFWETPEFFEVARIELDLRRSPGRPPAAAVSARLRTVGNDSSKSPGLRFDALRTLYMAEHPTGRLQEERALILELLDLATNSSFSWEAFVGIASALASRFYTRVGEFARAAEFAAAAFDSFRAFSSGPSLGTLDSQLAAAEYLAAHAFERRREEADDSRMSEAMLRELAEVLANIDASLKVLPAVGADTLVRIDLVRASAQSLPSLPWFASVMNSVVDGPWKSEAADRAQKLEQLAARASALGLGYEAARCHHLMYRAAIIAGLPELELLESGKALAWAKQALRPGDFRLLEFQNHRMLSLLAHSPEGSRPELKELMASSLTIIDTAIADYFRGSTFVEKANFATSAGVQLFTSLLVASSDSARSQYDRLLKIKGRLHQAVRRECEALRHHAPASAVSSLSKACKRAVQSIYRRDRGNAPGLRGTWEEHFRIDRAWRLISEAGLGAEPASNAVSLSDLQRTLAAGDVVIDFVRVDIPAVADRIIAFVYGRTGEPVRVDLGKTDWIGPIANIQRRLIADTSDAEKLGQFKEQSWFGTKTIWFPLAEAIDRVSPGATTVYIVPTRELAAFPFSSLINAQDKYLGETHSFAFLFSAQDLVHAVPPAQAGDRALLVGKVAYGSADDLLSWGQDSEGRYAADLRLNPLDTSELDMIGPLYASKRPAVRVEVLKAADAREANFWARSSGARILHLSTHGFVRRVSQIGLVLQAYPGVAFSNGIRVHPGAEVSPFIAYGLGMTGANTRNDQAVENNSDEGDDGILTAAEIMQGNLEGTDFVILSACEGAIGEYYSNEVMIGLAPAFDYAGARNIIATLTPVNSVATARLMSSLHEHVTAGLTPAQALSKAVRDLRASTVGGFSLDSPMYWAPFVAFGRQRPLFS